MAKADLTAQRLREILDYDLLTGKFTWLISTGRVRAGYPADSISPLGYGRVRINGGIHMAHRLAFLYVTGDFPKSHVDHIDGNRTNNRWANLRDATSQVNAQNQRRPHSRSQTGHLGVRHSPTAGKWIAQIRVSGKYHYLGTYASAEDASTAYVEAKRRLHVGCTI